MKKRRLIKVILKLQYQISGVYWNYKENSGNPSKLRGGNFVIWPSKNNYMQRKICNFQYCPRKFCEKASRELITGDMEKGNANVKVSQSSLRQSLCGIVEYMTSSMSILPYLLHSRNMFFQHISCNYLKFSGTVV